MANNAYSFYESYYSHITLRKQISAVTSRYIVQSSDDILVWEATLEW
jgi:hypothetical protein